MDWNFKVEGMMCVHCKAKVENALKTTCPKSKFKVDLESKEVTLSSKKDIDKNAIKTAIASLGFKVIE